MMPEDVDGRAQVSRSDAVPRTAMPGHAESITMAGVVYAFAAHSAGLPAELAEASEDDDLARFSAIRTDMIEPS